MSATQYALAASAGLLAAVNPCGFAMLPAYVSLLITGDTADGQPQARRQRLARSLALTGAMTLGFVSVFGAFGVLAAPAADWLASRLPWLTVVIGLILLGLGGLLVAGRELPSPVPKTTSAPQLRHRLWSMYLFGVSFAIASLGCTIGPFLAVVVTVFTTGDAASGLGLFLAYAGGMALIVGVVSVSVAVAQQSMIRWLRRAAPVISRTAGVLMILAGAYVAWYGWYEIRVFQGSSTSDPVIDTAAAVQTWLASAVETIGVTGFLIAAATAVAIITAASAIKHRRAKP